MKKDIVIGIDASRNRSGGAKAHIIGVLCDLELDENISEIHVWTYRELASKLPSYPWLIVHVPHVLEKGILKQLMWQRFIFPKELKNNQVDILLSTDAGTVCRFKPAVVMSRDMLSFEKGEMARYFLSVSWLRLYLLKYMQISSLRSANGAIFLTEYARDVISKFSGEKKNSIVIPHGISPIFRSEPKSKIETDNPHFIYVSNSDKYKHQWHVVEAFYNFRKASKKNASLTLVGANSGPCSQQVFDSIKSFNDGSDSVKVLDFVAHTEIADLLKKHDIFIFASSCENMPNTLIEAMASGLPVICSDRGPMPEVLTKKGVFFNPENCNSIQSAMESICSSPDFAYKNAKESYENSIQYSWSRCSQETINYLMQVLEKVK